MKLNSFAENVTLSNPINAHGEIKVILITCADGILPGTNKGFIPSFPEEYLTIAVMKQTVIPIRNSATRTTITVAVKCLLLIISRSVSHITAIVSRIYPR